MEAVKTYHAQLPISYAGTQYEALQGADALLVVTEWNEFRAPDFDKVKAALKDTVIFDGRNVYDLDQMAESGITYYSMGRKTINPGFNK